MVKTLKKGFLAIVLAFVALFALASCVIGGGTTPDQPDQPENDPTKEAQTALNDFTANVTFGNTDAVTTSFNLPIAGKKGGFNIPITWTSSNDDIITVVDLMENGAPSTYYKQAKVTRPALDDPRVVDGKVKVKTGEYESENYYILNGNYVIISEDNKFDDQDVKVKLNSMYSLDHGTELVNNIGMYMAIGIGALALVLILLPNRR